MQSPEAFFGFQPGSDYKIAHWKDIVAYFHSLAAQSDRVRCVDMGPTTLGHPFLQVLISAPENLQNAEFYRKISMLAADPRGLDEGTIDKLCADGRAVCVQSMSLHANEIGGAQMAPLLAYDLASGQSPEILEILANVIFILIPCSNPDGQTMIAQWYDAHAGGAYDGAPYPKLWHHFAGHSNNRDAVAENLRESRYQNQILFREWMPQAFQDHHHQGAYNARFFIAPYKNPLRPYCSPLVWRELAFYGAHMACRLEEEGVRGVISDAIYPCRGHFGFHYLVNSHNIPGMLTESASARLASPLTVHPEQLIRYPEATNYPSPWPGGVWRLSDIVGQQYIAAMGLLSAMAKNRERVLRNMTRKALAQTQAGGENPIQAFLIPPDQHDPGAAEKLVDILRRQGIELFSAAEPVAGASGLLPAGTVIVPTAQPKYGVVMTLLDRSDYPQDEFTQNADGSIAAYDVATDNIAEYMGVRVLPANCRINCKLLRYGGFPRLPAAAGVFPGNENSSFIHANELLTAGRSVYRKPAGDFITQNPPEGCRALRLARVGVYQTRYGGNPDEGYTRLLLTQYGFPFVTVEPGDITAGALERLDVLLLPNYDTAALKGQNIRPEEVPPEYRAALGEPEAEFIRSFVRGGGRLLALGDACMYVAEVLDLKVKNRVQGVGAAQFNTHGSTLWVRVEQGPLTAGMPARALAFHWNAPVLEVTEQIHPERYRVDLRFESENLLQSGLLVGKALITGCPAMLTAQCGRGEAVLYAFAPQFRAQTDGMYKVLFNALYLPV